MRRLSQNRKQIGKLSNPKIELLQPYPSTPDFKEDKNIMAALPMLNCVQPIKVKARKNHIHKSRVVQKIQVSRSLLLDDGREDPLPQINVCFGQPLQIKKKAPKNPEEQSYFDAHKRKFTKCVGTNKNEKQDSLVGKLYSPRSSSLILDMFTSKQTKAQSKIQERKIMMQQNTQKQSKHKNSLQFKNFLNHQYVKQLKLKQRGHSQIEDYNFKFNESTSSNAFKEQLKNNQKKHNSFVRQQKVFQKYEQKAVYITSHKSQSNFEVFLKEQGNAFVQIKENNLNGLQGKQEQLMNHYKEHGMIGTIITLQHQMDIIGRHKEEEQDVILIEYLRGVSRIKQMLIQHDRVAKINFKISNLLFRPLFQNVTQPEIHLFSEIILKQLIGLKPQLLSIKRFKNCVLITTKNQLSRVHDEKIGILRYFNGKFYVGGWRINGQNEGCKKGYGFQYSPSQFVYFGQYKQNMRNGYGLQKKISGEIYIGEWCQGKKQGWGKTFINDSLSQDGDFEQNTFMGSRLDKTS